MLKEDELIETMEKERHRTLHVWRDAVSLAREIYEGRRWPCVRGTLRWGHRALGFYRLTRRPLPPGGAAPRKHGEAVNQHFLRYALGSLAECDTQLIIAEQLGYGTYTKRLKAAIMSLTMGIRAYGKTLSTP